MIKAEGHLQNYVAKWFLNQIKVNLDAERSTTVDDWNEMQSDFTPSSTFSPRSSIGIE